LARDVRAGAALHNLPVQLTSFVGRQRELTEVLALMAAHRLVTLTGTGGTGKTRLALRAAADVHHAYPDGVWFVDLAPLTDAALAPTTIAQSLGVREVTGRPVLETLRNRLRGSRLLLVVDNCEHLLPGVAYDIAALLSGAPGVMTLATSRQSLGVSGEHEYPVPPLSLPNSGRLDVRALAQTEAIALFVQRAVAAAPDFELTTQNAAAVMEICRRVDGLPLAIELAAARIKVLAPTAIVARLDQRLKLLVGGPRDRDRRQQTLRGTFDWSHNLLTGAEQALFRRSSVFAGGFALEAAESVCSSTGIEPENVLELLTHLVDKSLLTVKSQTGEARYRLLEPLRDYARTKLIDASEYAPTFARHGEYFLDLAVRVEPELSGVAQAHWLAYLDREHGNLRVALHSAFKSEHYDVALRLAVAIWRFWEVRGHLTEGRIWLEAGLEHARAAPADVMAKALHAAGVLAHEQGDYAAAIPLYKQSLAVFRELNDSRGIASTLGELGNVARLQGDYDHASDLYLESLAAYCRSGDEAGVAATRNELGNVAQMRGDTDLALELHRHALALYRSLGDSRGVAYVLTNLGVAARYQGDYAGAIRLHEESLALHRELDNGRGVACTLDSLGVVARYQGDFERAAAMHTESLAIYRQQGNLRGAAYAIDSLGNVARCKRDYVEATKLHNEALDLYRDLNDDRGCAYALVGLGSVAGDMGDHGGAGRLLEEGLVLQRKLKNKRGVVSALNELARTALAKRDFKLARDLYMESLRVGESLRDPRATQIAHDGLTEISRARHTRQTWSQPPRP
jgi:non-specific serine/threonine protein kinase